MNKTNYFLLFLFFCINSTLFSSYKQKTIVNFQDFLYNQTNFYLEKDGLIPRFTFKKNPKEVSFTYSFSKDEINLFSNPLALWSKNGFLNSSINFSHSKHKVKLVKLDEFFNSFKNLTNFSIQFYFLIQKEFENAIIFERKGTIIYPLYTGKFFTQNLLISIKNNKVVTQFTNAFAFKNDLLSFSLQGKQNIPLNTWNHLVIQYNHKKASIEQRFNNVLEDQVFTTKNKQQYSTEFYPILNKNPKAVSYLGQDFIGKIDEFHFSNHTIPIFKKLKETEKNIYTSTYYSKVFSLGAYQLVKKVTMNSENIQANDINFFLCSSQKYFKPEKPIFCQNISLNQEIIREPTKLKESTFYQFFFSLKNRSKTFKQIKNITLHYQSILPPLIPNIISVSSTKSKITITWKNNLQNGIKGYLLFFSKDSFNNIRTKINLSKDSLLKNSSQNPHELSYTISNLESNSIYYLALKTYDIIGKEHASNFSKVFKIATK